MDLLKQTLELCKIYDIKPEKSKGQNFLVNEDVYDQVISCANLEKDDVVLEVGPGLGILTFKMSKLVKKVLAVELDEKLAEVLNTLIISKEIKNIKIFNNDVLKIKGDNVSKLGKYKIVANLPYNITSIFLRKFLTIANKPELIVLLLQKEVVERIISKPPKMSLLSISVQFYADAEIIAEVSKNNFYPAPQVESAIIRIKPRPFCRSGKENKPVFNNYEDEKRFFRLLKYGFSAKRKMLKNNLSSALNIEQAKIEEILRFLNLDLKCRAEQLSIDNWLDIFEKIDPILSSRLNEE
ncbi:ribosomal RNA small subunit methyltransferase A [Candidatus Falkowbacteria bacterium HGW-Falkowbacteria-1]|jgi:16S rRNA (adenine1518-N6/adenine1519-N6)-dimethyltransferase|uniref:Ribosomal RNA small subunit methyltransferase A n=1 Tax=Candidatus Falkowbacteria bacterium HGW-Falkowbacteria-1 TaxID=2013768 RepID=A0A2N2E8Q6_9BACT|nr:MAG: ribosomal RNA small subunit methyltransferase A [Candidatus Falkowbacteria bacterium HGW-Falkowbacteria-1]